MDRREIMYNDFVIIGPAKDPSAIKGKSIKDALQTIKAKQAEFLSAGTTIPEHTKRNFPCGRQQICRSRKRKTGTFRPARVCLATINIAAERNGYTMTDRGTYIKYEDTMKGNPPLKILVEGDAVLLNQYSVIAINVKHCPKAKYDTAKQFIEWITGAEAQQLIKDFKLLGKPLFTPNAKM